MYNWIIKKMKWKFQKLLNHMNYMHFHIEPEDMGMVDKVGGKEVYKDYKDIDLHNCLDNKWEHIYL
jgi:hypothetical protein